ncbi:MAG: hypothetical protein RIG63_21015 [Coleofasciculus chthonoplastes F3-SA18-01]|uniref:hypothetical protein n=1 Tax=Coleofasciculus chthonoplastes TaxID=64178 RepID=UPI003302E601
MKHSDWLRLTTEGERLCSVLRQQGYQCQKQPRRLAWNVTKAEESQTLTYLPAPVAGWTVLPNQETPARKQLMLLVRNALKQERLETLTHQSDIQKPLDLTRPWVIIRLLNDARRYTVARFYNRQDAEDHQRLLRRFMRGAEFEVIFDPYED